MNKLVVTIYLLSVMLIAALGFTIYVQPANGASIKYPGPYTATVERVIDGDTVVALINLFPSIYARLSIRIHGVDTPESSRRFSKCEKERLAGLEAKEFVKALFASDKVKRIKLYNVKFGKYAGRVLADISFTMNGKTHSLKDVLIDRGMARPYTGRKKSDWCQ